MELKTKVINAVRWTTTSTVLSFILQILQLGVVVSLISPTSFGIMSIVMVVVGFADIFMDAGVSNAIIQKKDINNKQLSTLYWLNIIGGVLIFFILHLITPLISHFYNEPILENAISLISLIFIVIPFGQQFQVLLQKELEFNKIAIIEIIANIAGTVVTIIAAFFDMQVFSLVYGQLTNTSIKTLLFFIVGIKAHRPQLYFKPKEVIDLIKFGLFQSGDRILNYLNANIDNLIIGKLLGAHVLGIYTLANNVINMPANKINPVITRIAYPAFSKIKDNKEILTRNYFKVITVLSYINFPIFFGLIFVVTNLSSDVFADKWKESIIIIQILSVCGLLRSIGNPVGALLMAKGRADLGFKFNLVKSVFQVITLIIASYFLDLIGIAIVKVIISIFDIVFSYKYLIKKLLGNCISLYMKSISKSLISSVLMSLTLIIYLIVFAPKYSIETIVIQILLGGFIYIITILRIDNSFTKSIMKNSKG
ncbi:MOP flippase family protein [Priestia megaterium]|uniref:MOP flippase family protein n=1 Tax=Priestia megaterium TaxID=1404 RepID=UPI0028777E61|nr:MOP flippase family protein [Priestia megaterium]